MLFSLPTGTEMFHFPAFPPTPYEFEMQVTSHDSRQVTPFGHPGITARLTAPPGLSQPPTSFIGPWYQGIHRPPLPTYPQHNTHKTNHRTPKQKCSRPLCKSQPTTNPQPNPTTNRSRTKPCLAQETNHRLFSQNLNRVSALSPDSDPGRPVLSPPHPNPTPQGAGHAQGRTRPTDPTTGPDSPVSPPTSTPARHPRTAGFSTDPLTGTGELLLRKEVIQPHLPVRLPCYDFVPIASPTFDGSPPCGLGHRLRVLPTFVT